MKTARLIPLLMIILFASCNNDPNYVLYTNVVIPIDDRIVPETGQVGTPVTIHAEASEDNGCWSNINFRFEQKDDREYEFWAAADFESTGVCPAVIVSADTTVSFTPTRTGNHVVTFWMSSMYYERDTIVVSEVPDGR
jgi:hypothetical protein